MQGSSPPEGRRHRFRLGPLLGAGTFGEVYLARMTSPHGIEQDVAVKLLQPGLSPRSQPLQRMRDEGRMLASLNHPAILQVMDLCLLDGRVGLVTELVPGIDLHDAIFGPDPIPPRAALQVVGTVADTLDAAYRTPGDGRPLGLVHRDVKPANIRITPHATVKLLDFGIAKAEDARREAATAERVAIGTPSYMAPEVQTCEVLDALPSRDVFALGCTLFEALTGQLYFEGQTPKDIIRLCNREERFTAWRSSRLPLLARHGPRVLDLVARMLRYDHTQRPTAREVADTCLEVVERDHGPSLRAWCRGRAWPGVQGRPGPWTGRELEDAGVAAHATAPVGLPAPPAAHPTLVAPEATVAPEAPEAPQAPADRARRRWRLGLGDALALLVALVVFAGAFLLWHRPERFELLVGGRWDELIALEVGPLDLPSPGRLAGWTGAPPVADVAWVFGAVAGEVHATVEVEGAVATLVREGAAVAVAPSGRVHLPPGPLEIRGPGESTGLQRELTAGQVLRLTCVEGGCYGW